jgi:hypothetical protein
MASVHDVNPLQAFRKFRVMHSGSAGVFLIIAPFLLPIIPAYGWAIVVILIDATGTILGFRSHADYHRHKAVHDAADIKLLDSK